MATYKDIIKYYKPYWPIAGLSIAAASLFEVIDLLVPYCIGQILNVLSHQPLDRPVEAIISATAQTLNKPAGISLNLGVLLGIIFIVSVIRAPIQPWIGSWFHWAIPLRARRDRARQVLIKILTLPLAFYDENNPGRIAGRVARGLTNHTWGYPEFAGQGVPKLIRVLGIVILMSCIEWRIAIALLLSFIGILAFSFQDLQKLISREALLDEYMENTESRTSEIITNIKTVKAFAAEDLELKRMQTRLDRELEVILYRIHKGYVILGTRQRTVVQCCVFGVLAFTLWATVQGQISIGHFVTTLTISSMAYSEVEPLSILAEFFARRYAPMLRFHEFLQEPDGKDAGVFIQRMEDIPSYQFTGKLEFVNLSFGYDHNRPVLENINLCIQPYQTVALVGRSGSGKSTLVKLLYRYFEPDGGQIFMDGEDILTLDAMGYRRRLAIVHQEVDVFNGTLLDNLVYGNPQASFEQVQAACAIAKIDDFIQDLPQGYATIVGERGVRLSGGQRQRLGIARALIVDPDVLIFDEATSNLDYESERSIQQAMRSLLGTRTLLIIAHRLSTVREADQIVVLDKGQIVETGSHESLLRQGGLYQRLHALQAEGELVG
jgi:ATP-binding cassette, subfamily B, bacterial